MKYQNLRAFEKHLKESPERSYLILSTEDQERLEILSSILAHLPATDLKKVNSAEFDEKELLDALESPSLFGEESAIFIDGCEKLGKKEVEFLTSFLQKPMQSGFLILGAKGKTALAKVVEKGGAVLDLTEEKPWDKEKRLQLELHERASARGKRLSSDAAPLLLERIGSDRALLFSELDKLICYVGERPTLERSDIFRISVFSKSETLWQMAESVVWEGDARLDSSAFHGLIPAIRSQLSLGLKIASLIEAGIAPDGWGVHLPKIWPKTLEKRKEQAGRKGVLFFQKGLELLLKVELLSRTGSNQEEALLDFFQASLRTYGRR